MIIQDIIRDAIKTGLITDVKINIELLDDYSDEDLGLWSEGDTAVLFLSKLNERQYHFMGMPDKKRWHRNKDISFEALTDEMMK